MASNNDSIGFKLITLVFILSLQTILAREIVSPTDHHHKSRPAEDRFVGDHHHQAPSPAPTQPINLQQQPEPQEGEDLVIWISGRTLGFLFGVVFLVIVLMVLDLGGNVEAEVDPLPLSSLSLSDQKVKNF